VTVRWAPADEIMAGWRPGSYDEHPEIGAPWTWADEAADLDSRGELAPIVFSVRLVGILAPVLLGDDGRVWSGHHRIIAGGRAGELIPHEVYVDPED
jgi:hypothetical protein